MRIAMLGPKGSYSEKASRLLAKRLCESNPQFTYSTVDGALRAVQDREADYAVVAVENTVDGVIGSTLDSLIDYQDFVKVCDEVAIPLRHALLANEGASFDTIKTIYSHATALNQCAATLGEHLPLAELIPLASTSDAARTVCSRLTEVDIAAICDYDLAGELGLTVITRDIQDYRDNSTRFLVCSLTDSPPVENARTLMAVRPGRDMPGLLYRMLGELAERNLNITFIQSRPYKVRPREYVFFIEVEGHKSEPQLGAALRSIDRLVREGDGWKKVLGSFPKHDLE